VFNNTVELSAIKYWLLSARAELPESRRIALDFLKAFTDDLPSRGISREDIMGKLRIFSGDYALVDRILSTLNVVTLAGWLEQDNDTLHPSFPELSYQETTTTRIGRGSNRNSIAKSTRMRVHARDKWTCWLCGYQTIESGASLPDSEDWDAAVDHVVPHAHGGSSKADNLRTAHRWCNMLRGDRPKPNAIIQEIRVAVRVAYQWEIIKRQASDDQFQVPKSWRKAFTPRPQYEDVSV
jgi:5-methylcytosine-specific restriction endonuclease McrA